jgi:hypothetical protein
LTSSGTPPTSPPSPPWPAPMRSRGGRRRPGARRHLPRAIRPAEADWQRPAHPSTVLAGPVRALGPQKDMPPLSIAPASRRMLSPVM